MLSWIPEQFSATVLLEDSFGGLWCGTYSNGLYYYNPQRDIIVRFHTKGLDSYISSDAIVDIYEDSKQNIWVLTRYGLNLLKRGENEFIHFTSENGFPSNEFYSIVEESNQNYWIGTGNGLVNFNLPELEIKIYSQQNGLLGNQFNHRAALKSSDNVLYFGSIKGLISFDPSNFKKTKSHSPIHLTNFQINGINQNEDSILYLRTGDQVKLNNTQSSFSLEFSLLDFLNGGPVEYQYKLDGLNKNWVNIEKNNKLRFSSLPPGNYQLLMKSRKGNQDWSQEQFIASIKLTPPFYASSWSYAVYLTLVLSLLFFIVRYYTILNK